MIAFAVIVGIVGHSVIGFLMVLVPLAVPYAIVCGFMHAKDKAKSSIEINLHIDDNDTL